MIRNAIRGLIRFLRHDLWQADLKKLPRWQRWGVGLLRIAAHVLVGFSRNVGGLVAAGLSLVTLLALVPMLAVVFALGKSFGFADRLAAHLLEMARGWPAELQSAVDSVSAMVAGVDFRALGVIGLFVMLWSGMVLFGRVEQALNRIWRVRCGRRWYRRVTDFIALMVVVPPLGLLALLVSSLLGGAEVIEGLRRIPVLSWLYAAGVGLVPHGLLWVAFAALYKIMPSAKVHWLSALVGGVLAGSALIVLNGLYVRFQVGVANANAVYGTLAALPLLLIYLQLAWTLVLAGAEVAYAVQNLRTLRGAEELPPASHAVRQRLAWHLLTAAAEAFRGARRGVRPADVCVRLDVPPDWLSGVADDLVAHGLLLPLKGDDDLLVPCRPPEQIDFAQVLAAIEGAEGEQLERVRLPGPVEKQLAAMQETAGQQLGRLAF